MIYLEHLDVHNNERLKIQLEQEREYQNRLKLHDMYLIHLLHEVEHNIFNKIEQPKMVFVTDFTESELKKESKLIQCYDVNIKKVIYPNLKKRFIKMKEFIDQNLKFEEDDKNGLEKQRAKFDR